MNKVFLPAEVICRNETGCQVRRRHVSLPLWAVGREGFRCQVGIRYVPLPFEIVVN